MNIKAHPVADNITVNYFCKYTFNDKLPIYLRGCLAVGKLKINANGWWDHKALGRCPNCSKILRQSEGELE